MFIPSIDPQSMRRGIIENGIKYIMLPIHLLRFCLFGKSSSISIDSKDNAEKKDVDSKNEEVGKKREGQEEKSTLDESSDRVKVKSKNGEPKEKRRKGQEEENTAVKFANRVKVRSKNEKPEEERKKEQEEGNRVVEVVASSSSVSSEQKLKQSKFVVSATRPDHNEDKIRFRDKNSKKKESDGEESNDDMMSAMEDSNSDCDEQWSSANSTMVNILENYDNTNKSYGLMEEPMDISMEECSFDKAYTLIMVPQDNRKSEKHRFSRSSTDEPESSSSVDEEISQIFREQCTSSSDEFASSSYPRFLADEKPRPRNFLYKKIKETYSQIIPQRRKGSRYDERERKKKTSADLMAINKRRKVSDGISICEKKMEYKSTDKEADEKQSTQQVTPSKHKSRASKTSTTSKNSKRKDAKYKEIGTQTDSAFSDDDVEMMDMKQLEKSVSWKYVHRKFHHDRSQSKEMEHKLHYMADNEDSNDFLRIAEKQILSSTTSSSSPDLSFDEYTSTTLNTDIVRRRHANFPDITNTLQTRIRAPPGFPEIPQNPPLSSSFSDPEDSLLSSKENIDFINKIERVPPAPAPMRHLYYDYPEFMDVPIDLECTKVQNSILRQYYYQR